MNLIINNKGRRFIEEINKTKDLLDILIDYGNVFLPEEDQLAQEIYNSGDYDYLIVGLDFYYKGDFLEAAISYFKSLDEVVKMSNLKDIVSKIEDFNEALLKGKVEISFLMK